jgi:hypothetical protein
MPTAKDLEDARLLFALARRFWPTADILTCLAVEVAAELAGQHTPRSRLNAVGRPKNCSIWCLMRNYEGSGPLGLRADDPGRNAMSMDN